MTEKESFISPPETEQIEQIQPQTDTVEAKKENLMEKAWNMLNETQQQALVDNIFSREKNFIQIADSPDYGDPRARSIAKTMHKGISRSDMLAKTQAERAYDAYFQKSPEDFVKKMEEKIRKMEADIIELNKLLESDMPYDPAKVENITSTIRHIEETLPWLKQILEQKKSPEQAPENQEEIDRQRRLENIIARELGEKHGPEAKNAIKILTDLGMDFLETTITKANEAGQEKNFIRTTLFANPLSETMPPDIKEVLEQSGINEGLKNFGDRLLKFLIDNKTPHPTVEALRQLIGFSRTNSAGKLRYPNQEEARAILEFLHDSEEMPFAMYTLPDVRNLNNMMYVEGKSGKIQPRHHRPEQAPAYGDGDNTQFLATPAMSFENKLN